MERAPLFSRCSIGCVACALIIEGIISNNNIVVAPKNIFVIFLLPVNYYFKIDCKGTSSCPFLQVSGIFCKNL